MTQPASEGRPNAEYGLIGTGERFRNADGTSRQAELASCRPGDAVALVREPDNPRDPMAIALMSARGVQLGYIRREDARWLAQEMDDGREARAVVHDVRSRSRPGSPLSIALSVSVSPAWPGGRNPQPIDGDPVEHRGGRQLDPSGMNATEPRP